MKAFSIFVLFIYEVVLMIDNESWFRGNDIDRFLIRLIPIVVCLIIGLG